MALGLCVASIDNARKENRQHDRSATNMHTTNQSTVDMRKSEKPL